MNVRLQINIVTVSRGLGDAEPIHGTLSCIKRTYPGTVHVFTGSEDVKYLFRYKEDKAIEFHYSDVYPPQTDFRSIRANWNFHRALSYVEPATTHLLLLEDDIVLSRNWYKYLLYRCLPVAYKRYGVNYVMFLYEYHVGDGPLDFYKKGLSLWDGYPVNRIACSQAIVYPVQIIPPIALCIKNGIVKRSHENYDTMIKVPIEKNGIKVLTSAPCLVQHMGVRGSGIGGNFHQTRYYVDEVSIGEVR